MQTSAWVLLTWYCNENTLQVRYSILLNFLSNEFLTHIHLHYSLNISATCWYCVMLTIANVYIDFWWERPNYLHIAYTNNSYPYWQSTKQRYPYNLIRSYTVSWHYLKILVYNNLNEIVFCQRWEKLNWEIKYPCKATQC